MTFADAYAATGDFSAERQFAFYDAATRRAVAEGYAGLRVVAELSALAADPQRRDELVRWEQLADQVRRPGAGDDGACAPTRGALPGSTRWPTSPSAHPADPAPRRACARFHVFFEGDHVRRRRGRFTFEAGAAGWVRRGSPTVPAVLPWICLPARVRRRGRLPGDRPLGRRVCAAVARDVEIRGAQACSVAFWQVLALRRARAGGRSRRWPRDRDARGHRPRRVSSTRRCSTAATTVSSPAFVPVHPRRPGARRGGPSWPSPRARAGAAPQRVGRRRRGLSGSSRWRRSAPIRHGSSACGPTRSPSRWPRDCTRGGSGSPPGNGRREVELVECKLHELLLNRAFD